MRDRSRRTKSSVGIERWNWKRESGKRERRGVGFAFHFHIQSLLFSHTIHTIHFQKWINLPHSDSHLESDPASRVDLCWMGKKEERLSSSRVEWSRQSSPTMDRKIRPRVRSEDQGRISHSYSHFSMINPNLTLTLIKVPSIGFQSSPVWHVSCHCYYMNKHSIHIGIHVKVSHEI